MQVNKQDKSPALRRVLLAVWAVIVLYTVYVLGEAIAPHFNNTMKTSMAQNLLGISSLLLTSFYYIVDILLVLGFSVIGGMIVMHSSDDWFAIFTSIFLITFGVRVTDLANMIALPPGTEFAGGLLLAMGDIGIVLFTMLFPDGKFTPRWLRFAVPPLVIMMLGIYLFPNAPFFWDKLGQSYLLITTSWYLVGFFTLIHRYFRRATYGGFSVCSKEREILKRYILNQEEHYRRERFEDEYVRLSVENEVEYNADYLW